MQVGGTKMSKRFGNFLTVRDLQEEGVDAGTFRLLVFQTHYRKELDYNDAALASARDGSRRLDIFRDRLRTAGGLQEDEPFRALAETLKTRVTEALDDDLNAPRAVAALFDFVTEGNRLLDGGTRPGESVLAAWRWVDAVLDLCPSPPPADDELERWVAERIADRARARAARDFQEADRIREELRARGVEIEDTPGGTKWRRI
jgi:cysteinyl-tRNA synthetase